MSATRLQELLLGIGFGKQTNISTPNLATAVWSLRKLNAQLANPKLKIEDDAAEYGKGNEFAFQTFDTSWDVAGSLEKYLGSEIGAWAMAFGLGKVVKSGTAPNFVYTCTPLMPSNGDATELPYFTMVEQIRPGVGAVLDRAQVGCVVEGWTITIGSGPGRAQSKIVIEYAGTGQYITPSAIVLPTQMVENLLPSASLAVSINGVDYVSNKNIVSLETSWKNNVRLEQGFFPGSGFQTSGDATSGAIRGRMEYGNRVGGMKFVARFDATSSEYAKLRAQTTGTAVFTLTHDANNSLQITWEKVDFTNVEIGETDQFATVAVECLPMYDATNGLVTAVATVGHDGICQ